MFRSPFFLQNSTFSYFTYIRIDIKKQVHANHIDMFENKIVHLYQFIGVLGAKNPFERKNIKDVSGAIFKLFFIHFKS